MIWVMDNRCMHGAAECFCQLKTAESSCFSEENLCVLEDNLP